MAYTNELSFYPPSDQTGVGFYPQPGVSDWFSDARDAALRAVGIKPDIPEGINPSDTTDGNFNAGDPSTAVVEEPTDYTTIALYVVGGGVVLFGVGKLMDWW